MEDIKDLLDKYINDGLKLAVASNPGVKAEGVASKLKVRPVVLKGKQLFQAARTVGAQELHENTDADGIKSLIAGMLAEGPCFRQLELTGAEGSATVLISKKGHVTVKEHGRKAGISLPAGEVGGPDHKKNYIIREGIAVPFLVELGVMNKDGFVVKARYDKFRQINRYLEFVNDILPELTGRKSNPAANGAEGTDTGRKLEIIDFGCGKSYLTFALYHFLHESIGLNVHITGLDLKKDVIADCGRLAEKLGYGDLEFKHGDIADYETNGGVDMVVTLHACDTATDYALFNAIRWNARVIFCVPCCQHELNKQIKNKELEPVLKYGIIRERMSALITDAMRAQMLEEQGYKTQILEFIDMEHTPKNLLIRAVKKGSSDNFAKIPVGRERSGGSSGTDQDRTKAYEQLLSSFESELTLHRLLKDR
ncbi:MAG: SAM-dependent methyltransferase [Lachnospiraceae bacterium]|nr:SAM-dependent methyltransferase [Lachnospiraceae bacterium]